MSELPQVIWHVYFAGPWTSGVQVVGAKWRREVPPSRRLTAREQALPWAYSSVPARWRRVNQATFVVGILAAAGAFSKTVNAGFCRLGPKLVIAVLLVKKPPITGGPGMPVNAIEPHPRARNAAENRPDAIAGVRLSDQFLQSQRSKYFPSSRPSRRSKRGQHPSRIRHRSIPRIAIA
jgi:hypothetical protein